MKEKRPNFPDLGIDTFELVIDKDHVTFEAERRVTLNTKEKNDVKWLIHKIYGLPESSQKRKYIKHIIIEAMDSFGFLYSRERVSNLSVEFTLNNI